MPINWKEVYYLFKKRSSFNGGIHPPYSKGLTKEKVTEICKVPQLVTIPLQQHIGAPCQSLVNKGDKVFLGQKIGEPRGYVSAPVHSSVSGVVKSIVTVDLPTGIKSTAIIIENDGNDTPDPSIMPGKIEDYSREELNNIVMESGVVGMGGATFPTHVKLSPPSDRTIDTIILNGSECEPYLTSDYRLMLENPDDVIYGLRVIMKILDVSKGYIGIEDDKTDAIEAITSAIGNESGIQVVKLRAKYPQGAEKQMIQVILGREVPSGGLPMDVGTEVNNVGTAAAIANAVKTGMPLYQLIVTVSGGAVREPKNVLVRLGTSFKDVIDFCGGWTEEPDKVIAGGPMMGHAQHTLDVPVIKGTSGILLFTGKEAVFEEPSNCIRCSRCVEVCPVRLAPLYISAHSLKGNMEEAEKLNAMDCIECGCCSYICPAYRPLLPSIQVAKKDIIATRKRQAQTK
ncbi:MAG: electron transport complex subunit RsxC [Clostridiales bacterium]|nr:electron transport complex subunit RsxC [Clostridiales bacterium]